MLDAIYLHFLTKELQNNILNCKVDKIYQISKEEILINFRTKNGSKSLIICSRANSARVHLTNNKYKSPDTPPMFCMLLRKYLNNAKLIDIKQIASQRIVIFDFNSINEIGSLYKISIIVEIMGRYSNIILTKDNVILDAIKRIDFEMSSVRQILPNLNYELPPLIEKKDIFSSKIDDIIYEVLLKNQDLSRSILNSIDGISPVVAREICFISNIEDDKASSNLNCEEKTFLFKSLEKFQKNILDGNINFNLIKNNEGKYIEFSFIKLNQYLNNNFQIKIFESPSKLLDEFYFEKDKYERNKQKFKLLINKIESLILRFEKKISLQNDELQLCEKREEIKLLADLLSANLYQLKKGDKFLITNNFYSPENEEIKIELNPLISPSNNLKKYYDNYKKTYIKEKKLKEQIQKSKIDIEYLNSVLYNLMNAESDNDFEQIKYELFINGYIKIKDRKVYNRYNKKENNYFKYKSNTGFTILAGKNNIQNDYLTFKKAEKHDLWFHTKNIHGSHVILITDKREVDDDTYTEAAMIAAYHSNAKNSPTVSVDYTNVKNVKKIPNAKTGMVTYNNYYTAYVKVDKEKVKSMFIK